MLFLELGKVALKQRAEMAIYQSTEESPVSFFLSLREGGGVHKEINIMLIQIPRHQHPFLTATTKNWCSLLLMEACNIAFTAILITQLLKTKKMILFCKNVPFGYLLYISFISNFVSYDVFSDFPWGRIPKDIHGAVSNIPNCHTSWPRQRYCKNNDSSKWKCYSQKSTGLLEEIKLSIFIHCIEIKALIFL